MSELNGLLSSAAGTVCIHSASSFSIFGRRYDVPERGADLDGTSLSSPLAHDVLAEVLYATLHCRRTAEELSPPADWAGAREFTHRISASNSGSSSWQPGWILRGFEPDGQIVAEKFGIRFWMPSSDFEATSSRAQIGDTGWVRVPKECWGLLPGFYLALGDAREVQSDGGGTVRVYWHLWSGGTVPLMDSLTRRLNQAGVGFSLKVLAVPLAYPRSDAAVLYLPACAYQELVPLLGCAYREIRPWLRPSVSAFAKTIAPGVGLAEDPGDGASFGQHRCRLVATELTRPGTLTADTGVQRWNAVMSALRRNGWDPERLYLNPGSLDRYPPLDRW
jgi:hypothetical protein